MTKSEHKKGLILTVGTTHEPIVYSLRKLQPNYVAFIYTPGSSETLDKVLEAFPITPSCLWQQSVQDDPEQIGRLVQKLYSAFCWLKDEKQVQLSHIYTDPTPGRKWMSAGATMISSFLGLQMFYTDAKYSGGRLDPATMRLVPLGNAYDQTGFIEAENARKLFNQFNFSAAGEMF
ncbi:hypothetical protein, partial [Leptolyngbya sp. FACHB-711]|uniref:hypothetical protein n=1 Tax=Leptolyngbya sp. FACHB-711 TaxID=2692813 RepID=UPI0016830CE4